MKISIYDFFKMDKYRLVLKLEYNEVGIVEKETIEMIMVKVDNKFYNVEFEDIYLECTLGSEFENFKNFVILKEELNDIIDRWNKDNYRRVLDYKLEKIS